MKILILIAMHSVLLLQPAFAIKKCQDDQGNWHYGDTAEAACSRSKITTLNDRGFITDQQEAPKTQEELAAEESARTAEEEARVKQEAAEEERQRILSIYETEDDIDRQRDNQLDSVQSNIDVHTAYLKSMESLVARDKSKLAGLENDAEKKALNQKIGNAYQRIMASQAELAELEVTKQRIKDRFAKERDLYLSYKAGLPTILPED